MDHTEKQNLGTIFMHDVYRGMTGIEKGRVKFVRVMEAIGTSWDDGWRSNKQKDGAGLQASAVSLKGDVNIKKIHGIATVHEDGSALFTVPAVKNIFFQALDENYMELQRMRSFLNLMPGEKRSCVGCHERRQLAPDATLGRSRALGRPVEKLRPQPGDTGPRVVHYAVDIRPILDKHCVGCHGSQDPKGGLDLTGELTKLYDRSYENFINKSLVGHLNDGFGAANVAPEPPLTFGSHQSGLVDRIRKDPCKAKLTREEFIRIVTWVDADAPYFGTHRGKKNLQWKDDPDFRPLPQPGE
jgi:mono/diheme cytochrome c family protein